MLFFEAPPFAAIAPVTSPPAKTRNPKLINFKPKYDKRFLRRFKQPQNFPDWKQLFIETRDFQNTPA
jgi:hypothetical protein